MMSNTIFLLDIKSGILSSDCDLDFDVTDPFLSPATSAYALIGDPFFDRMDCLELGSSR